MTGNPWKLTAIGMALVAMTALVTGVVVANRSKPDEHKPVGAITPDPAARPVTAARPATPAHATAPAPAVPKAVVVKACNEQAAAASGPRDKTMDTVKDGAVGALLGAAVGAAGGAIADGGKGAGKGAAIGGLVGGGAGALYGLNENRKHDAAYRDAYASCLRSRGYRA
jgi:hypothetical protein